MGQFSTTIIWLYQEIDNVKSESIILPSLLLKPLPAFRKALEDIENVNLDFLDSAVKKILEYSQQ